MKFIEVIDQEIHRPVLINVSEIIFIAKCDDGKCFIRVKDEWKFETAEKYEEVASKLVGEIE